jgi:CBS-domain-containing membrane protein
LILGGAAVYRCDNRFVLIPALAAEVAKNSLLHLILGGAAVYRCDNCFVLIPALAAEVAALSQKRLFSANYSCSVTKIRGIKIATSGKGTRAPTTA